MPKIADTDLNEIFSDTSMKDTVLIDGNSVDGHFFAPYENDLNIAGNAPTFRCKGLAAGFNANNQLLQSEALDAAAAWSTVNASIVADRGLDSQGNFTLDLINDNAVDTTHRVIQGTSAIITAFDEKYSLAFEVRAAGQRHMKIEIWNFNAVNYLHLNLITGVIGPSSLTVGAVVDIQNLGGGLFKVVIENLDSGSFGSQSRFLIFMPASSNGFGGEAYLGIAGEQGISVGRIQMNLGASLANYVRTTTAPGVGVASGSALVFDGNNYVVVGQPQLDRAGTLTLRLRAA